MWDLGDVLDLSCWQEGGLWGRGGREAAPRMLSVALVMWGELGRGRGHTARCPSQHWRWALRRAPASAKAQRPRCR
eukprot:scaffold65719_cov65-Phaeocystis_antarctica.AAC.3